MPIYMYVYINLYMCYHVFIFAYIVVFSTSIYLFTYIHTSYTCTFTFTYHFCVNTISFLVHPTYVWYQPTWQSTCNKCCDGVYWIWTGSSFKLELLSCMQDRSVFLHIVSFKLYHWTLFCVAFFTSHLFWTFAIWAQVCLQPLKPHKGSSHLSR